MALSSARPASPLSLRRSRVRLVCGAEAERLGIIDEVPRPQVARFHADHDDALRGAPQVDLRAFCAEVPDGYTSQRVLAEPDVTHDRRRAAQLDSAEREVVIG